MKNKLTLITITAIAFLLASCNRRQLSEMFTDQTENKARRDAAAEEFGGVKEAMKTHYWNGSEFVEGRAPSNKDK